MEDIVVTMATTLATPGNHEIKHGLWLVPWSKQLEIKINQVNILFYDYLRFNYLSIIFDTHDYTIVCSRPEYGLRCWLGVKPPLKLRLMTWDLISQKPKHDQVFPDFLSELDHTFWLAWLSSLDRNVWKSNLSVLSDGGQTLGILWYPSRIN